MDSLWPNRFDILEVYRRYRDILSGNFYYHVEEGYRKSEESEMAKCSREELAQLLEQVESHLRVDPRISIVDELRNLIPHLHLMVDSEFSHFYEFVFFVCRENGQKNISESSLVELSVTKAICAWRLVLVGRFRLLDHWCDFVEKNQRHNISEDTWKQVLAFSRSVHEDLKGYDRTGAWPVLIDEFVEYKYRVDSESKTFIYNDSLPGLRSFPGSKRKCIEDMERDDMEPMVDIPDSANLSFVTTSKRNRLSLHKPMNFEDRLIGSNATNEYMEITRHSNIANNNANAHSSNAASSSHCAIEDCLSQGIAGLFPTRSCLQLKRERRSPFGQKSYRPSAAEKVLPRVL